jgi:DNA repair exonuclease SbcCD ATPase subunit
LAVDESYRDLTNLLPKLQKHQALEAEISKNKDRLNVLNETGGKMVADKHYATPEIKQTLGSLNKQWEQLDDKAKDKGKKLREAARQELFNKALEDANAKLAEMERLVSSDDIGKDLRGVRSLLHKHQVSRFIYLFIYLFI